MISAHINLVFYIELLVSDDYRIEYNRLTARDSDGLAPYAISPPFVANSRKGYISEGFQRIAKCRHIFPVRLHRTWNKNTNPTDFAGLLPVRRERPSGNSATDKRDEFPSPHGLPLKRGTNLSMLVGRGAVHHSIIGRPKSPSGQSPPRRVIATAALCPLL
jgi:hypothetical protein